MADCVDSEKNVRSFLGQEAYSQLVATVGKDEIFKVNEKLSSRIEEHSQLKETLASLKDENRNLRRGQKTSNKALRRTKEKEEHLVQAYMRQTDEKFKCLDDLQLLVEESILFWEKCLESTMEENLKSFERLLRAEKGKLKTDQKKQRLEIESTQKKIRALVKLNEQTDEEALMDIFHERTRNLKDQHKSEMQDMERIFERLQKERAQEHKTFSKAILRMKVKYQIIVKDYFMSHENPSEPSKDKPDGENECTKDSDMKLNRKQDCEKKERTDGQMTDGRPACADEKNTNQDKKEKDKRLIERLPIKAEEVLGPPPGPPPGSPPGSPPGPPPQPPPPTPIASSSTSRSPSPSPPLLPLRGTRQTTPPSRPPRRQFFPGCLE